MRHNQWRKRRRSGDAHDAASPLAARRGCNARWSPSACAAPSVRRVVRANAVTRGSRFFSRKTVPDTRPPLGLPPPLAPWPKLYYPGQPESLPSRFGRWLHL